MKSDIKNIIRLKAYLYLQLVVYRLLIERWLSVFALSIPDEVKGDPATAGLTIHSLFKIIDVKDPYKPETKSTFYTYGYVRDIKASSDGTNDYLAAVGGKVNKNEKKNGVKP